MAKKSFVDELGLFDTVKPFGEGEVLLRVPVNQILPDPTQPRRVVPEDLRDKLLAGKINPEQAMWSMWERCLGKKLYDDLRSGAVSAEQALEMQRMRKVRDWALQLTLEGLVALADSIDQHGLRQPINVYHIGEDQYRIGEGERRWWAHVILSAIESRQSADTIEARSHVLPADSLTTLARQNAENTQRQDLAVIARARAVAHVRDIVAQEETGRFLGTQGSQKPATDDVATSPPPGSGKRKRGRPRKAKVISSRDLDRLTGERVAEVTGRAMGDRMVRNYLRLLELPGDVQALAEAADLSEKALRPLTRLTGTHADLQLKLAKQLAAGQLQPAQVASRVSEALSPKKRLTKAQRLRRFVTQFRGSVSLARGKLPDPVEVASRIANLPADEQADVMATTRRYADYLLQVLQAAEDGFAGEDE